MYIPERQHLRQQLRQRRRNLSQQQQRSASHRLCFHLKRLPVFKQAKHIAIYWPNDGEISPLPLLEQCPAKTFYLPILKNHTLRFKPFNRSTPLYLNKFSIPEPVNRKPAIRAQQMDLILMPLVGFDTQGNRLGMGGGFYDRSCAFMLTAPNIYRCQLIGLAHACQQVTKLPFEPWDVPLHYAVTNAGRHRFN